MKMIYPTIDQPDEDVAFSFTINKTDVDESLDGPSDALALSWSQDSQDLQKRILLEIDPRELCTVLETFENSRIYCKLRHDATNGVFLTFSNVPIPSSGSSIAAQNTSLDVIQITERLKVQVSNYALPTLSTSIVSIGTVLYHLAFPTLSSISPCFDRLAQNSPKDTLCRVNLSFSFLPTNSADGSESSDASRFGSNFFPHHHHCKITFSVESTTLSTDLCFEAGLYTSLKESSLLFSNSPSEYRTIEKQQLEHAGKLEHVFNLKQLALFLKLDDITQSKRAVPSIPCVVLMFTTTGIVLRVAERKHNTSRIVYMVSKIKPTM